MSDTRKEEERALSRDELELADRARRPGMQELGGSELSDLIGLLRDRRDRARAIADRQRREMRGKAPPAGAAPAEGDAGSRAKVKFLAVALRRAQDEAKRRRAGSATSQAELSEKALAAKRASGAGRPEIPETRTADEGMESIPNERIAPSGAFDDAGDRPVLERSRKVR